MLFVIGSGTCLLVALVNYEPIDTTFFINRALVYSLLTLFVISGYILAVGSLSLMFQSSGSVWFSLVATGLVAVLFQPVRERIQHLANKMLYGTRDEPYQLLTNLGQRLEAAFESEAVLPTITHLVQESLHLPYVAIALEQNGVSEVVAATGEPQGQLITFPLTHQGTVTGHLLVNLRRGETRLSPQDRNLLTDLTQQASVAVHSVRLTAELQQSRERLILAREEERRRLRRDLHDDLAPTLIGLSLWASSISDLIETDPTKAAQLADNLDDAIRNTVKNIRRLVYDLRPPALDDLGLLAAIRERTFEYSNGHGLRVEVDMPETLPPLPAAVEVAAYRIIQEALLNALKHAHASTCSIHMSLTKELHIEIFDDGIGFPEVHTMGVGLHSIQERTAELGGTCQFMTDVEKGTRIVICLPVKRRERT